MNTFLYCLKQGFRNFFRNYVFSIASVATVGSCIFLFCMFLALAQNLQSIVRKAETNVGITVFFDENLDEAEKEGLRNLIAGRDGVEKVVYISADEAWENFRKEYFGDRADELSEAFNGDNPLADSDSFEIFMTDIEDQDGMVSYLSGIPGIRDINYANNVVNALKKVNRGIYGLSAIIIGILFAVSVFLISNTISVAAEMRRRENGIMRLIGATNYMIMAPFAVEGVIIGTLGAIIPLTGIYYAYKKVTEWMLGQVASVSSSGALKEIMDLIPLEVIFPDMLVAGLVLGVLMGFIVSSLTIIKHLKV